MKTGCEVRIWYIDPETLKDAELKHLGCFVSPEEQERILRFRLERCRREYLVAHAMIRLALSEYTGFHPGTWVFTPTAHGCPEIAQYQRARPLRFSLSHCRNLVACAITETRDIGIDVEDLTREHTSVDALASWTLSARERELFEHLDPARRPSRLLEYWSIKESYAKARGLGLSMSFRELSFELGRRPVTADFSPLVADDPRAWEFFSDSSSGRHVLSLSVRTGRSGSPDIVSRSATALFASARYTRASSGEAE